MDIKTFSKINKARSESVSGFNHKMTDWTLSDWMTALTGEVGGAANIIKKMNRLKYSTSTVDILKDMENLKDELSRELADVYCSLDLLVSAAEFDLESIVIRKYNEVSKRLRYPTIDPVEGTEKQP